MKRRLLKAIAVSPLGLVLAVLGAGRQSKSSGSVGQRRSPNPVVSFSAGAGGQVNLQRFIAAFGAWVTQLRLRADLPSGRVTEPDASRYVSFLEQFPEYGLDGSILTFDGSGFPAIAPGAAAARLRIEAKSGDLEGYVGSFVSDVVRIYVDAPLAIIKHGLDAWKSFDELTRTVCGNAAPGSAPAGRTDLIGKTFEITPGMFSEDVNGSYDNGRDKGAAATIQFPCTIRAIDPDSRPVFRSTSGQRSTVLVQAIRLPPVSGEVVLQDLVIRDNRGWYDTGEAGVRVKDSFPGRSLKIERCEFVRCQNAVSGGTLGQIFKIHDCRIVDCGFGGQAHGLYVSPEWLEFFGNVVTFTTGNRFARAHLLKTRSSNARILGNKFSMNDCAASYLIDISNGGVCEIGGNLLHFGPASDNDGATVVAYAPEGSRGDSGHAQTFAPGRRFRLSVRNNTMLSDFPGNTDFVVVYARTGARAEGGTVNSFPDPLVVADNVYRSLGSGSLVIRRDVVAGGASTRDLSSEYLDNVSLAPNQPEIGSERMSTTARIPNAAGYYVARRFTGATYLGTGSAPHVFKSTGAG